MDRRAYLRGVGGVGAVGVGTLAGCAALFGDAGSQDYDIGMSTRDFRPEVIEVNVGETVVWRNTSSHAHTVTAYEDAIPGDATYWASGGYESEEAARQAWRNATGGALYQGDVFEHTFSIAGEHHYVCIPHEMGRMVGTVVVG